MENKKIPWWQPRVEREDYEFIKQALDANFINEGPLAERLEKEIASVSQHVASLESRIGNADFVARAPAEIVEGERKKLEESKARLAALEAQLNSLK